MRDMIKAMTYDFPARLPVTISFLPAARLKYGEELRRLAGEYPDLLKPIPEGMEVTMPQKYHQGIYTDEWGCVWQNIAEGMDSIVTGHPVKTREDILALKIPKNRDGRLPHGFMYLRLLDLRGFEEAMIDFAEECDELQVLIDKVLRYQHDPD